jgi:phosphopantetheinyl transferase (holo-ACP synthase)
MTNSGNDIVSLQAINITRTKQPQFYSKILTDSELNLFKAAACNEIPFEKFVWLLWSIKESAFKVLKRNRPVLIFSPTKFVVNQLSMPLGYSETNFGMSPVEDTGFDHRMAFKGMVTFESDTLFSRSLVYQELIVSVAQDHSNFEHTCWGVKLIDQSHPKNQSFAVRKFLINKLRSLYHWDGLRVDKSPQGFPVVLAGNKEVAISVSLSHHDLLVAYSFSAEGVLETIDT